MSIITLIIIERPIAATIMVLIFALYSITKIVNHHNKFLRSIGKPAAEQEIRMYTTDKIIAQVACISGLILMIGLGTTALIIFFKNLAPTI